MSWSSSSLFTKCEAASYYWTVYNCPLDPGWPSPPMLFCLWIGFLIIELLPSADKSLNDELYDKFLMDFLFNLESVITLLIYFAWSSWSFAKFCLRTSISLFFYEITFLSCFFSLYNESISFYFEAIISLNSISSFFWSANSYLWSFSAFFISV
jgi:hypothetical protein